MCPCDPGGNGKQRHRKDKSCNILQCMAALKSNDPDALYRVAQGPCACGYSWQSCTLPQHAVALDALADCLFRANQYTAALSTALATVRLDPASAVVSLAGTCAFKDLGLTQTDRATAVELRSSGTCSRTRLRSLALPRPVSPPSFSAKVTKSPLLLTSDVFLAALSMSHWTSLAAIAASPRTVTM